MIKRQLKLRYFISIVGFVVFFSISYDATAQPVGTGRSVGLVAAGSGMMYGTNAAGWNPANLGMKENPRFTISLPTVGFSFGNNSFTPKYISETFVEGDTLFDDDKLDIIGNLDSDGFKLFPQMGIPLFGISFLEYAFNVDLHFHSFINVPADLFEMILYGPQTDQYYDLSKIDSEAEAYVTYSLSAAKNLTPPDFFNEFSVGATFKYFSGYGYGSVDEREGKILLTDDNIEVDGRYKLLYTFSDDGSLVGDGVGLDLAFAGRTVYEDIYVGVTIGNLIGNLSWTDAEYTERTFFHDGPIDIESIEDEDYLDSLITQSTVKSFAPDFITPLPRYILFSASKPMLTDWMDFHFGWYQGLNESSAHNRMPKLSFGTEISYFSFLPVRLGLSFGGLEKFQVATGFGIDVPGWKMDFGFAWQRGLFFGAEGLTIGFSNTFGG